MAFTEGGSNPDNAKSHAPDPSDIELKKLFDSPTGSDNISDMHHDTEVENETSSIFSAKEIDRLKEVRSKVEEGDYNEMTLEAKKLEFVRWLIEHDRLKS